MVYMGRTLNLAARAKILQSAHTLIFKGGFKGVSMDDIATSSGIKKANLFHYYPTKEALGLAVFEYAAQEYRDTFSNLLAGSSDPLDAVQTLFDNACKKMKDGCCAGGCFVGNMAQELSDHNETIRQKIASHLQAWTDQLAGFFESWKSRGFFRTDFNSRQASQSILSLFEGATLFCKATRQTSALDHAKACAVAYLRVYKE